MKLPKFITVGVPVITTACFLALCWFAWQRVVAEQANEVGYTEKERQQLANSLTPTKPVSLWKRVEVEPVAVGHVMYDSKTRAEILGLLFNTTPEGSGTSKGRRL